MIEIPTNKEQFKVVIFHVLGLAFLIVPAMLSSKHSYGYVVGIIAFMFYHLLFIVWHATEYGGIDYLKSVYILPRFFKFRDGE